MTHNHVSIAKAIKSESLSIYPALSKIAKLLNPFDVATKKCLLRNHLRYQKLLLLQWIFSACHRIYQNSNSDVVIAPMQNQVRHLNTRFANMKKNLLILLFCTHIFTRNRFCSTDAINRFCRILWKSMLAN